MQVIEPVQRTVYGGSAPLHQLIAKQYQVRQHTTGYCSDSLWMDAHTAPLSASGGSKGVGRGGRAPSPQKFQPCFLCCMECGARLTFDQRTVYVLSTARVTRSV